MSNQPITLSFLGTGNYLAQGRYWNSFVVDGSILVEPSPTAMPHLRRVGLAAGAVETVFVSHFHPDHTFGWPFFALDAALQAKPDRSGVLHVVGPPGVEAFFAEMARTSGVMNVHDFFHGVLDVRYVEVDGTDQTAGDVRFRAVRVEHVPHLDCFGFLIQRGDRVLAYSGDTEPCAGLEELAGASDVLVLECNGPHRAPSHMDVGSVRELRERHPDRPAFVLTHIGQGVDASGIPNTVVPDDFDVLSV